MRMELLNGINNCIIINDIYNSDFESLKIALDFFDQQNTGKKKTLILSDIFQSGLKSNELYEKIASIVNTKKIFRFIGIGKNIIKFKNKFKGNTTFYNSTSELISNINNLNFENESILLKGSRVFEFEKITNILQEKSHSTILEINLDALVNNLNFFRSLLKPGTKVMIMVKAFAYGSGTFEIAKLLQFHKVDYLAVAIADEGISLRKNGIHLPILVMNPENQELNFS